VSPGGSRSIVPGIQHFGGSTKHLKRDQNKKGILADAFEGQDK